MILSVCLDGSVDIWDVNTGILIRKIKLPEDRFSFASFNQEGDKVVTGSDKSGISVWNVLTGAKESDLKPQPADLYTEKGFKYPETGTVYYSADNQFIISGVGDNTAILFDVKSGKEIRKYKKTNSTCTSCIAEAIITPDNKFILSSRSDSVKMFDRVSGRLVREFYGQGGSPEGLSISPDNKYISAIEYGVAEVWDLNSGKLLLQAGDYSDNKVLSAAISPDGKHIITGSEKRITDVWDISSGEKIMTLKGYLNQVDERILTHSYIILICTGQPW